MENHPIPQDITGFKFKLIGDMTIKQFAYIAGGVIIGWVFYISPLFPIIKIPIALFFCGFGVALAFLPVAGRPFDVMIINFFKAVFSPTQYIYIKSEDALKQEGPSGSSAPTLKKQQDLASLGRSQFASFLGGIRGKKKDKLDEKESVFFQNVTNYASSTPATSAQPMPKPVEQHSFALKTPQTIDVNSAKTDLKKEEKPKDAKTLNKNGAKDENMILQKQLNEAKSKELQQAEINSKDYLEAHQKVLDLQKNLNDTMLQKQELEQKISDLQKQAEVKPPIYSATVATEPVQATKFVRSIPNPMGKGVGLPIAPEFPNVVTGIIKDPRGNPIPNILVEVKDSQDNAVRAFKTNALGQFASATPLVSGKYTVYFEDPKAQNKFDAVEFEANGQIILPIEVISVDSREELRRSLFSN